MLQRTVRLTPEFHREESLALLCTRVSGERVIAGALNLAGVSAVAVQISWILFVIGSVLLALHVITGRTTQVA